MIQIEDWVILAGILALFIVGVIYLFYFIISKKLFAEEKEFQKEITPNQAVTALSVDGAGIIKKIEMQVTENSNTSIDMIIDGYSYTSFDIAKESNNSVKINDNEEKNNVLKVGANLDTKFHKGFQLSIYNRNDYALNSKGILFYEIKKPLKDVLKALYKETVS